LKEKYADLRKKAKTMNFSIAYGKTAHGFQKDWDCSLEEAQDSLKAWYADRQEVVEWQIRVQALAL
jgi:DNA polymerase-1